jgi:hypothetical protein
MKTKTIRHAIRVIVSVMIFVIVFCVCDLIAKEAPTELELYQDIFRRVSARAEDSRSESSNSSGSLLEPVEKVKVNTEEYVLRRKGVITHDQLSGNRPNQHEMFKHRNEGPKISVTF